MKTSAGTGKQVGYYFYSYGFLRAYRRNDDGTTTQIGSLSGECDRNSVREFHARMCAELGPDTVEFFGGYYAPVSMEDKVNEKLNAMAIGLMKLMR